jgi:AmmeMemoRadiSam system protein B/AmmeMemoRadiSam system protein A
MYRVTVLLCVSVVLLGIFAIFFWRTYQPEPAASVEKKIEPEEKEPTKVVLRSQLAGSWYPAEAEELSKQIEGFFQKAEVEPIKNVMALILPHAGYRYSGQTAACALKTTDKKYKRVVVIGPSHRVAMEEVLSVPRVTHYQTPLGQIPLDVEFIGRLLEYPIFQNVPSTHKYEHSVQIELPLLQFVGKDFKVVPIVAGTCSLETITTAAAVLRSLVDEGTLVVASSDFTHYGRGYGYVPFRENIPEQIKKLDMGAYEHIANLDTEGFLQYKRKNGATICGYIPIAILLSMLDEGVEAKLIHYTTSGELMSDFSNSVSYLSVAFVGRWANYQTTRPQHNNPKLTEEDKKQLLALARKSILHALEHQRIPQESELDVTLNDEVKFPRGAFVTLKKNSQLRGCIGDIFPQRPLCKSVIINAINAGFRDRRFRPLTKAEYEDITIEISALTVPQPVGSPGEIRIGVDGVVLNKDGHSAVFLPQVAPEQGWDVEQMLTQLSRKAGLPADAWKEGASFLVFQADVFGEEK